MEIRRSLLVSYLLALTASAGLAPAQTVSGALVQPSQTSLTLPAGNQVYIYGMATGGNSSSSNLSEGAFCQLIDGDGYVNAGLASTTSNSNSFGTSALYYTVGGVAVSGSTTMTQYCAANNTPGATAVSDTFNLTQNSLVVMVGLSGGEASLTLSGPSGLQIDAQAGNPGGGVIPMAIAHASLPAGTYTVTENSVLSPAPGQNPNNMGDLIGVFVFPLSQDPGSTSSLVLVNGTINGQNVTPANRVITVSPGGAITGSFAASINSSWSSNAVMAMGVTPSWGTPSSSFVDLGGFATPVSGIQRTISLNLTAPSTPGTYYIIAAFRAEYTAAEVMSCTNWSVGSPNWNSGDAIADWPTSTINTADAAGTVLVNYLFPSGNTPQYVPATAIQVVVTDPPLTSSSDPGSTSSLLLVNGTINGQNVTPANRVITVSPGAAITGSFTASINSSWSSSAVMAMGVTPSWGTPSSSFVDLGGFATPVSGLQRTINLNLTAPTTPGTYYIIAAFRAEYTAAEVMSCTNWSVGSPNWSSGDAIADWPASTINTADAAGTVLVNYLFPSGNTPQYVPATAIQVVVTNSPIITVSPSAAVQGQTITLTGGGFLSENVVYISSPGVGLHGLRVASANGTVLTFAVNPAEQFPVGVNTLYVNNANGNTNSISITVSQ